MKMSYFQFVRAMPRILFLSCGIPFPLVPKQLLTDQQSKGGSLYNNIMIFVYAVGVQAVNWQ